jgi:hypothetical protein
MSSECPKWGRPMWATLRREGGQTRAYHVCPDCEDQPSPKREQQEQSPPADAGEAHQSD